MNANIAAYRGKIISVKNLDIALAEVKSHLSREKIDATGCMY